MNDPITPTIRLLYSCRKCGTLKRPVEVQERGDNEEILAFVHRCAQACSRDHDAASPGCYITKLDELWIPVKKGPENEPGKLNDGDEIGKAKDQ